jgi:hypothetical protein
VWLRLPMVPGGRAKGARIFPSHATVISIRSWDTRCLSFPCKIPANLGKFHVPDNSPLNLCSSPLKVEVQCQPQKRRN